MAKKNVSPIMTWTFWSILVLAAFLLITWDHFVEAFTLDSSKITWLIMGFFIYGFGSSFFVALYLQSEFKALLAMDDAQHIGDANSSDVAAMFDSAMERIRRSERIEVRTLVSAYGAKIKARVDNIHVVASMLITIGLLGTVVGLIMTVNGLDQVLQSNSADFATMKMGLTDTVSGMGTAFYTTFIGALLGGVVLKVLGSEMRKSGLKLVADTLAFSELFISPQFARKASESLVEMEARISTLGEQLGKLGTSLGSTIETLDSKQATLAEGLGNLVETVDKTSRQANERTEALVATVASSIEETSRRADERLSTITTALAESSANNAESTHALITAIAESVEGTSRRADERLGTISTTVGGAIEQSARHAAEQLETIVGSVQENLAASTGRMAGQVKELVEASKSTVEETSRLADERATATAERIGAMVDTANQQADERIKLLAETVGKNADEANRLADERLQSLLSSIRATHEEADKQMAGFVENVEKAVEKTRQDAEQRLNAKAADLANKLNEAATMLSGLVAATAEEPKEAKGE